MGSMPCSADGRDVGCVVAPVQDAAVNVGVQGLDAAVEHLRKAGQVADVAHGQPGLTQRFCGPAGRNQLHPVAGERLCERHQSGLIGNGKQGAADRLQVPGRSC